MTKRLFQLCLVLCLTGLGLSALGERAQAGGAALATAASMHGGGDGKLHLAYGKKSWRLEPPYAFYPPPRVGLRCFKSRHGYGNCPYAAWGKKDTGSCWYEYGKRVCGPAAYRERYPGQRAPAYKGPGPYYYK